MIAISEPISDGNLVNKKINFTQKKEEEKRIEEKLNLCLPPDLISAIRNR